MNTEDKIGRVVVVTGGSRGIGRAIVGGFANSGCRVAVASRDPEACEAVAQEMRTAGGVAKAFRCDVRREEDVKELMSRVLLEWNALDVVVSNAGIAGGGVQLADYSLDRWTDLVDTHLTGSFLIAREAVRVIAELAEQDDRVRHLVFMGSFAAIRAHANKAAYSAVKGGIAAMATAIAEEVRGIRLNVSTVFPGSVATDVLESSGDIAGKPIRPETVAEAVQYLASIDDNALVQRIVLERREEV